MLDNTTKKNIDDCRDVLVGKVPDPKSQIEQITLALIYKFMDDMDKEAVEKFKGKAKFFTGTYAKYGWRKLFDPSLGGKEMLDLYSEALEKLQTNPNIPELFRNIFKNAYLPYRDPATLKLFLKHINVFDYSHSEKLGDAFEYLLSVMGSQGDAGQFRTPRHIIDFVTACVDPQKGETVLDPACGTAGFLLSAYKHILKQNTDKRLGDKLKPDDRKKLATNFVGYDISPDMVRLSLANMYLHGFSTPQIHEYDTLTSEDRWQDTFDVILANPPFMTPKGGIRPHKRFSVQANKAEVLFTDYISEHLSTNGRAGIVVPNGIVANGQTAYKKLRKMLLQDGLIAVISLPAGIFQPYSNVTTSVLILDKPLSKLTEKILFLKVDNDGFDLGAQRKEIDKNDLPDVVKTINSYKAHLISQKKNIDFQFADSLVDKSVILGSENLIFSGERYNRSENNIGATYPTVKLSEVASLEYGFTDTAKDVGDARFVRITDISEDGQLKQEDKKFIELTDHSKKYLLRKDDIVMARTGATYGKTMIFTENYPAVFASFLIRINVNKNVLLPKYYWCFAQTEFYWQQARALVSGGGQPQFNGNALKEIEIPLPPLAIQKRIVEEVEAYQTEISGLKKEIRNIERKIKNRIGEVWSGIHSSKLSE